MVLKKSRPEMSNGAQSNIFTIEIECDTPKHTSNGIHMKPTKDEDELQHSLNHENGISVCRKEGESSENGDQISLSSSEDEPELCSAIFSWRAAMYLLLHLSFIALNLPRSSINMALVCINTKRAEVLRMANMSETADTDENAWVTPGNTSLEPAGNGSQAILEQYNHIMNDINWDSDTVGLALAGSLFLSCLGPLLFDGIRQLIGSRNVITITLIINATLMFTSPVMARTSPYVFLANRVLLGLTLGGNAPIVGAVLPRWTPEKQRLTATTIVFAGYNVGAILSSVVNGFLCSISIDNGWPFIFYVSGIVLVVYAVAWFFLMADSPESHPFISDKEKVYIQSTRSKALDENKKKPTRPPYLAIAMSVPVLAYIFAFSCFVWTMSVSVVYIPIFLNTVLGFDAEMTGILFAVIACTRVTGSITWTSVGNYLTNSGLLSQPATRKTCICVGLSCASICCFAVSFFDRDYKWVAITFIMSATVSCHKPSGYPLYGISSQNSYSEWRVVWFMLSAIYLTASLVFLVFGDAKIQPWAAIAPEKGRPNRDIDELSTEISVTPVVEPSASSETQSKNGHVMSLEPGVSQLDIGESQTVDNHMITQKSKLEASPRLTARSPSQSRSRHVESKSSSYEQSSSKVERAREILEQDNSAFEKDVWPETAKSQLKGNSSNLRTYSSPCNSSPKAEKNQQLLGKGALRTIPQSNYEQDISACGDSPLVTKTSAHEENNLTSTRYSPMEYSSSNVIVENILSPSDKINTEGGEGLHLKATQISNQGSTQEQEEVMFRIIESTKL